MTAISSAMRQVRRSLSAIKPSCMAMRVHNLAFVTTTYRANSGAFPHVMTENILHMIAEQRLHGKGSIASNNLPCALHGGDAQVLASHPHHLPSSQLA